MSRLDVNVGGVVVESELQEAVEIFHASARNGDAGGTGPGERKVKLRPVALWQVQKQKRDFVCVFDGAPCALDDDSPTSDLLWDAQFNTDLSPFRNSPVGDKSDALVVEIKGAVQNSGFSLVFALHFRVEDA
jgi:hypothetical protein